MVDMPVGALCGPCRFVFLHSLITRTVSKRRNVRTLFIEAREQSSKKRGRAVLLDSRSFAETFRRHVTGPSASAASESANDARDLDQFRRNATMKVDKPAVMASTEGHGDGLFRETSVCSQPKTRDVFAGEYHDKDFLWEDLRKEIEESDDYELNCVIDDDTLGRRTKNQKMTWNAFHKQQNSTAKFFRPRRYLLQEFPRLAIMLEKACEPPIFVDNAEHHRPLTIVELGCGNGSTVVPLLEGLMNVQARRSSREGNGEGAFGSVDVRAEMAQPLSQEFWCGEGSDITRDLSVNVVAVDFSAAAVEHTKMNAAKLGVDHYLTAFPADATGEALMDTESQFSKSEEQTHLFSGVAASPMGLRHVKAPFQSDTPMASDKNRSNRNETRGQSDLFGSKRVGQRMQPSLDPALERKQLTEGTARLKKVKADAVIMTFLLSAIPPEKMKRTIKLAYSLLNPGGSVFFRDYGLYDLTQLRFPREQMLSDKLFFRSDGTLTYYFSVEELRKLFGENGFKVDEASYACVALENRKRKYKMRRVFTHGVFTKVSE